MVKQDFQNENALTPNREHKASVFSMLFSNPAVLRELYSAIEGVELRPDIPIDINTLQDVLIKGKLNDISFIIDNRLVILIEHQSSICENMPLRMYIYLSEIYKRMLNQNRILQRKLLKIPKPEFIVLYNGKDPYDDYKELKLSTAFKDIAELKSEKNNILPLELIVKVYNINEGHNSDKVKKSHILDGYSVFIGKIREYQSTDLDLAESIKHAVEYCIEHGILKEFLCKHRGEIMNTLLQDLTPEEWQELYYEEGLEDGIERGLEQGLEQGLERGRIEIARNLKKMGIPIEQIVQGTGLSPGIIETL